MSVGISVDRQTITDYCQRWRIAELALFGSVLRDDFRADSDVDVLVTFANGANWSLFDHLAMRKSCLGWSAAKWIWSAGGPLNAAKIGFGKKRFSPGRSRSMRRGQSHFRRTKIGTVRLCRCARPYRL
jgi:hypothetical protein